MDDRAALYAGVLAHPHESTPRMMFADFIDDNPADPLDPAHARFIRTQVRMEEAGFDFDLGVCRCLSAADTFSCPLHGQFECEAGEQMFRDFVTQADDFEALRPRFTAAFETPLHPLVHFDYVRQSFVPHLSQYRLAGLVRRGFVSRVYFATFQIAFGICGVCGRDNTPDNPGSCLYCGATCIRSPGVATHVGRRHPVTHVYCNDLRPRRFAGGWMWVRQDRPVLPLLRERLLQTQGHRVAPHYEIPSNYWDAALTATFPTEAAALDGLAVVLAEKARTWKPAPVYSADPPLPIVHADFQLVFPPMETTP